MSSEIAFARCGATPPTPKHEESAPAPPRAAGGPMSGRPRMWPCPFCHREFGSASLPIHMPRCRAARGASVLSISLPLSASLPLSSSLPLSGGRGIDSRRSTAKPSPAHERSLSTPATAPPPEVRPATAQADRRVARPCPSESDELPPEDLTLLRCRWCERTFLPERLLVHEASCDARKHGARLERSRAATSDVNTTRGRAGDDNAPASPWRQHHQELQKAMAARRKGGAPSPSAGAAPSARDGGPPRSAGSLRQRPPGGGRAGLRLSGESWGLGCGGGGDPTRARGASRPAALDAHCAPAARRDGALGVDGVDGARGVRGAGFASAPPQRLTAAQRHARDWAREQEEERARHGRAQPVGSHRAAAPPRAPPSALELRRSAALLGPASAAPPLQPPPAQAHGHFARASSACGAFANGWLGTASTVPPRSADSSMRAGRANGYWPGTSSGARAGRCESPLHLAR